MKPYATVADLEKFWRLLTASEKERAEYLIKLASNQLRQIAKNIGQDLDEMIKSGEVLEDSVKLVVMEAVKRAMLTPLDNPPVNSASFGQTAGLYSETQQFTYTNPAGDLWFKGAELRQLKLSGVQSVGSLITTRRTDIYGE